MPNTLNGPGFVRLAAQRFDGDSECAVDERVAEEVPVALIYNGLSHAVMMASPSDLEDFALGFSLTEGILAEASELLDLECREDAHGICIDMRITERRMEGLRLRRRNLTGRTGCGLCGADSLAEAIRPVPQVKRDMLFSTRQIHDGLTRMESQQALNRETGAVHAAALIHGEACLLREDIGRHNALDKLIGAATLAGLDEGFLVISSRASYEMVHKAAMANIPLLAAISAPSALAVRLAEEADITLIGFARGESMTCYTQGRARLERSA